jgi:ankyrin repeat protein
MVKKIIEHVKENRQTSLLSNKDGKGNTPLTETISSCDDSNDILDALLKAGADCSVCNKYGYNALTYAAYWEKPQMVKKIIEHVKEKDPDLLTKQDNRRQTPLEVAQKNGYGDITDLLQEASKTLSVKK